MGKTRTDNRRDIPDEELLEQERPLVKQQGGQPEQVDEVPDSVRPLVDGTTVPQDMGLPESDPADVRPAPEDRTPPDTEEKTDNHPADNNPEPDKDSTNDYLKGYNDLGIPSEEEYLDNLPLPVGSTVTYKSTHYHIREFKGRGGYALAYTVVIDGLQSEEFILKEFCPYDGSRRNADGIIRYENNQGNIKGFEKFWREPDRVMTGMRVLDELPKERVAIPQTKTFTFNNNCYFVQSMVDGCPLVDFMRKAQDDDTPMTVSRALEIAEELCYSVIAIHHMQIVHLDLSPSNVMVDIGRDGRVRLKVIDFGVATSVDDRSRGVTHIDTAGTDGFKDNSRTRIPVGRELKYLDIYSMGALLNYMLFFEYRLARQGSRTFDSNWTSLAYLRDAQQFVAHSSYNDEQRRSAIIRLIQDATCEPSTPYVPNFRPNADEFLMRIRQIRQDIAFVEPTIKNMKIPVPCSGERRTIKFNSSSDIAWEAEVRTDFPDHVTLDTDHGDLHGQHAIEANFKANTSDRPLQIKIIIRSGVMELVYAVVQQPAAKVAPDIYFPSGTIARSTVGVGGAEVPVTFTATSDWHAVVASDGYGWLSVNDGKGTAGTQTVRLDVSPNTLYEERSAGVTFHCGSRNVTWLVVQQPAERPYIRFVNGTMPQRHIPAAGETVGFSFHTNTGWETAVSPPEATGDVSLDNKSGGDGSHTINVTVKPNTWGRERHIGVHVSSLDRVQHIDFIITQDRQPAPVQPVPVPPVTERPGTGYKPDTAPIPGKAPGPVTKPKQPATPDKAEDKNKATGTDSGSKVPWQGLVLLFLLVLGGVWYWNGRDGGTAPAADDTAVKTEVTAKRTAAQPAMRQKPEAAEVEAVNATIARIMRGDESAENFLRTLSPSLEIYEMYGDDTEVAVGSTMRELLGRENANIIPGRTHTVIDLHRNPDGGLIDELIIKKTE